MTIYTKNDIGKVIVPAIEGEEPTAFLWRVVEFAKTLGYDDSGVDYSDNNYGLGERGFVDDEDWAEARVAYGFAIDYISSNHCDKVSVNEIDGSLRVVEHWWIAKFGEESYDENFGGVS